MAFIIYDDFELKKNPLSYIVYAKSFRYVGLKSDMADVTLQIKGVLLH